MKRISIILALLLPLSAAAQTLYRVAINGSTVELINHTTGMSITKLVNISAVDFEPNATPGLSKYTVIAPSKTVTFYYQQVSQVSVSGGAFAAPASPEIFNTTMKSVASVPTSAAGGGGGGSLPPNAATEAAQTADKVVQDSIAARIKRQIDSTGAANALLRSPLSVILGSTSYTKSTSNNTTTQLAPAATFTGAIESALNFPQLLISYRCNQPTTLLVRQYQDAGGTVELTDRTGQPLTYTRAANGGFNNTITLVGSYYRVELTNSGAAATTNLNFETWSGQFPATPNLTNNGNMPVEDFTQDVTATGTIAANATPAAQMILNGQGSISYQVTGTFVATLQFQVSNDGTNWVNITASDAVTNVANKAKLTAGNITASGVYEIAGGQGYVRLISTAYTSGTATVSGRATRNSGVVTIEGTPGVSASQSGTWNINTANFGIPGQVTDIASAAINATTTTAAVTPTTGTSFTVVINVTAATGGNPSMQVNVEQSYDGGTTWQLLHSFPAITAVGGQTSPLLTLTGNRVRYVQTITGPGTTITRSVSRLQTNTQGQVVYQTATSVTNATITTGGASQVIAPANPARQKFVIRNISSADIWFNYGTAAGANIGQKLAAGESWTEPPGVCDVQSINVWGATTGQQFSFKQW
ncbi:MAG: hypothetical protein ACRC3K_10220 [Plesiomonas sp.]